MKKIIKTIWKDFRKHVPIVLMVIVLFVALAVANWFFKGVKSDLSEQETPLTNITPATVNNLVASEEFQELSDILEPIEITKLAEWQLVMLSNGIDITNCDAGIEAYYWDFTSKNLEKFVSKIENGKKNKNFYVHCYHAGSAGFTGVYVFKNNKLIFYRDDIYRGRVFMDNNNNLNIIFASYNPEANCCPKIYWLTQYRYNAKKNTMEKISEKEYSTQRFKNYICSEEYYNKELCDFEKNNSIEEGIESQIAYLNRKNNTYFDIDGDGINETILLLIDKSKKEYKCLIFGEKGLLKEIDLNSY